MVNVAPDPAKPPAPRPRRELSKARYRVIGTCRHGPYGPARRRRGRLRAQPRQADAVLTFIVKAGEGAGYRPGEDFHLGLDAALTEFFKNGRYELEGEVKSLDQAGLVDYLADLVARYPIATIEDGCAEDDLEGWAHMTEVLGGKVQLVGDDLFVTALTAWRLRGDS